MATRIQNRIQNKTLNKDAIEKIIARKQELLTSFTEKLFDETHKTFQEMVGPEGHGDFNLVAKFCLPNQGASPRATYWTGSNDDATKNGIPIVMFLQGDLDREDGTLHPERLPGGKTAIQLVNERLDKADARCSITLFFDKRSKELHVFLYDHDHKAEFDAFIAKKKQERPPREPSAPATEKPKTQLNEWVANKLKQHLGVDPRTLDDDNSGFQEVRRRGGRK
jgi:hypothetical protein